MGYDLVNIAYDGAFLGGRRRCRRGRDAQGGGGGASARGTVAPLPRPLPDKRLPMTPITRQATALIDFCRPPRADCTR